MNLRRRRFSPCLALVAYALLGAIWAKGLVLCFEADGHVSLEFAADCSDCCSTGAGSTSSREGGPSQPSGELGSCPCLDVAIVIPDATQQKLKVAGATGPHGFYGDAARILRDANSPARTASATLIPRSHASSALAIVRTTVLLV